MRFSKDLIVQYKEYLETEYGADIDDSQAEEHLNNLANLFIIKGGWKVAFMFSKPFYTPVFRREDVQESKRQKDNKERDQELKYEKIDFDEEHIDP